jgi:hypothetical protein
MKGNSAGYEQNAGGKRKKTRRRKRERHTTREADMPVKNWRD